MSFAITVYVREGIVMAADSRLSLNSTQNINGNVQNLISVGQSDSNQKLFVTEDRIGIFTVGAADINGVPIAGFVDQFIRQNANGKLKSPDVVADGLITFFGQQATVPDSQFHVAGYDPTSGTQQVFHVYVSRKTKNQVNPQNQFGVAWAGEADVLSRIINPSAEIDPSANNAIKSIYPNIPIPYNFFTLQDAIDFSVFAVRTTIETIRFQPRPKSVGGPIDVLVIRPNEAKWIQRKELSVK